MGVVLTRAVGIYQDRDWIPLYLFFFCGLHWISCAALAALFSFNLDEIEEKRWEETVMFGMIAGFALGTKVGAIALVPAITWPLVVLASNWKWDTRLNWREAEWIFGASMAVALNV